MEKSGDHPKTSDEEWSNFEDDSEEQGSGSDDSRSGEDEEDLTDHQSDEEDEKQQGQSDTETRNLLDDADFEEDVMLVEEEGVSLQARLPDELDDEVFSMSPEQQEYYTQVFMHLQYLTQGDAHLDGAIRGSDNLTVSFFRKSGLDTPTLGKIWDLADINIDGKLNRYEFCVAMHLIVLNKKGNVPIPKHLPSYFNLRLTPPRFDESPRSSEGISVESMQLNGADIVEAGPARQQSRSDDKLHVLAQQQNATFNPLSEFASDPPMCVDRVPMPVRSNNGSTAQLTGTLSLGSNPQTSNGPMAFSTHFHRGPPPDPPPRAYQKGHTRSASLDLNAKPPIGDFRNPSRFELSNQRCLTLPANSAPPSQDLSTADSTDGLKQSKTLETMFTPSDLPSSSSESQSISASQASAIQLKPDYHSRCTVLRQVNAELEAKLATLSQIRLQLKLRVEEVQGKATGPNTHLQ